MLSFSFGVSASGLFSMAFGDERGRKFKTKIEMINADPTHSVMETFFFFFDDRHEKRYISITIEISCKIQELICSDRHSIRHMVMV